MKQKDAFTLVEMLIVIAVVVILAMIAVSAYGVAKRQAEIDLVADNIVSAIKQQQSLAKSGRLGADDELKCYGLYLNTESDEDESPVKYVQADYYPVLGTLADYCDILQAETTDFLVETGFKVSLLEKFGSDQDDILIIFKPPFAKIAVGDMTSVLNPVNVADSTIKIGVDLIRGEPNPKYVEFDISSGLTKRVYEQE